MTLRRVDASDPASFDAWFAVLQRSEGARSGAPGPGWFPDEWRARAIDEAATKLWHLVALDVGGEFVAVGALEHIRDDGLPWIRGELHVDPEHRRRGHGTTALAALEQYAIGLGRQQLVVGVSEGSDEVGGAPNRFFAPRCGYHVVEEAARRDIDWPRPPGELDDLEARWRPFATGYEILDWTGPTPSRWVDQRAHLSAVMPVEAPHEGLEVDEEQWDADRLREHERTVDAMGRELLVSVARHVATDTLAGYSELTVSRELPTIAYQWDTLVLCAHRGHRLGGLMKVATMRRLATTGLAVERISTHNAVGNRPMIEVNDALGARVSGGHVRWLKDLARSPATSPS